MRKFESDYKISSIDSVLDKENQIHQDIDLRLDLLEAKGGLIDQGAREVVDRGIEFIKETLAPAAERILTVAGLGFLQAHSSTKLKLVDGEIATFVIQDTGEREMFRPSPFVTITRRANIADFAFARVESYTIASGELVLTIFALSGTPDEYSDWVIYSGTAISQLVLDILAEVQNNRDQVFLESEYVSIMYGDVASFEATVRGNKNLVEQRYVDFRRRYYGTASIPPTARYDGTLLQDGDLYTQTGLSGGLRLRKDDQWIIPALSTADTYQKVLNLSDVPNAAVARINLGVPSLNSNLADLPDKKSARDALGVFKNLHVGNSNATVPSGFTEVLFISALTADRTITLPAASGYNRGETIVVRDPNNYTGSYAIKIGVTGTDSLIGGNLFSCGLERELTFVSNGTNAWTREERSAKVRFDRQQTLSDWEKATARSNIAASPIPIPVNVTSALALTVDDGGKLLYLRSSAGAITLPAVAGVPTGWGIEVANGAGRDFSIGGFSIEDGEYVSIIKLSTGVYSVFRPRGSDNLLGSGTTSFSVLTYSLPTKYSSFELELMSPGTVDTIGPKEAVDTLYAQISYDGGTTWPVAGYSGHYTVSDNGGAPYVSQYLSTSLMVMGWTSYNTPGYYVPGGLICRINPGSGNNRRGSIQVEGHCMMALNSNIRAYSAKASFPANGRATHIRFYSGSYPFVSAEHRFRGFR